MKVENLDELILFLNKKTSIEKKTIKKHSEEWHHSIISTYNYLCKINYLSSRSYTII